VEISSGSLGHGLPLGVGLAHGLIASGLRTPRVFVLVGDAELDEGSNNEAIVYAGAVGLPNLFVVAVDNQSSSYGWGPGGIEAHFAVSGWAVTRVPGRDHGALAEAFAAGSNGRPYLVVATVEGRSEAGPMLDRVLDAVAGLDVTVAYATTVRPFDAAGLRSLAYGAASGTVVLVEPYLAGTSAHAVSEALAGPAYRLLSLGAVLGM
jgi:deoxyxylulose-5-phosphate synthase